MFLILLVVPLLVLVVVLPLVFLPPELQIMPYEIVYEELHEMEQIEEGSFGQVFKASWQYTDVAVKLFRRQLPSPKEEER
jgi:predicted Ser/Thr protein kinase